MKLTCTHPLSESHWQINGSHTLNCNSLHDLCTNNYLDCTHFPCTCSGPSRLSFAYCLQNLLHFASRVHISITTLKTRLIQTAVLVQILKGGSAHFKDVYNFTFCLKFSLLCSKHIQCEENKKYSEIKLRLHIYFMSVRLGGFAVNPAYSNSNKKLFELADSK